MLIPEGFTTVTPYMFVKDAEAFIDFLQVAFDAKELHRTLGADERIANAQLRIGTSTFMISEATPRYVPMPSAYYLYVENADSAMQKAMAAGASLEMAVMDMPYGDRQGGVIDPFGNIWWVSQRLVDAAYA